MTNILDILRNPTPEALPVVKAIVRQHPYYHLAHLALLKLLYEMRDPAYNDELRTAALYLPSRQTIYNLVEGNKLLPMSEEELQRQASNGATLSRKPNQRLTETSASASAEANNGQEATNTDRTGTLLDNFLTGTVAPTTKSRPARPIDATVDYISYMLQEEETIEAAKQDTVQQAQETPAEQPAETTEAPAVEQAPTVEPKAETPQPETDGQTVVDSFIQKHGDRRIRLKDKKESELQKPKLDVDNNAQGGAFTETLARIYIKQGKYEHAIDIITRLAQKYPNKNRYYNDQIRFLSKIITNSKAATKDRNF